MPIRFRCAYCNQLMGIARRKAGTVVRCPRCAGQVIVPNPEAARAPPPPPGNGPAPEPPRQAAAPVLFEQSDFEKLFEPGPMAPNPAPPPPAPIFPAPAPANVAFDVEPMADYRAEPLAPAGGIFLTPAKLTLLSVAFVILLGLAFLLGLLVGRE